MATFSRASRASRRVQSAACSKQNRSIFRYSSSMDTNTEHCRRTDAWNLSRSSTGYQCQKDHNPDLDWDRKKAETPVNPPLLRARAIGTIEARGPLLDGADYWPEATNLLPGGTRSAGSAPRHTLVNCAGNATVNAGVSVHGRILGKKRPRCPPHRGR